MYGMLNRCFKSGFFSVPSSYGSNDQVLLLNYMSKTLESEKNVLYWAVNKVIMANYL